MTTPLEIITIPTAPKILTVENAASLPQFIRAKERPVTEPETFLFYGGVGTGKTELLGTAGDRSLFVNIGNGIKTILSPGFRRRVGANPITVDIKEVVDKYGIFTGATAYDAVCDVIDHALAHFSDDFDWVCLDDAEAFNKAAMHKGLESNKNSRRSNTLDNIKRTHVMEAAIQDYQAEMNLVEQFLYGTVELLKSKGKHFAMTAQMRETFVKGDKIGDLPKLHSVRPGFTGQTFPDVVPGYFDNVFLMQAVSGGSQTIYRCITAGDEIRYAKTRWSEVFETVETNPNLSKFLERIRGRTTVRKGK